MHALLTAAALAGGMDNAAREAEAERLLAPLRASRTLVTTFDRVDASNTLPKGKLPGAPRRTAWNEAHPEESLEVSPWEAYKAFKAATAIRGEFRTRRDSGGRSEIYRASEGGDEMRTLFVSDGKRKWDLQHAEKVYREMLGIDDSTFTRVVLGLPPAVLFDPLARSRHRAVVVKRTPDYVSIIFHPRPQPRQARRRSIDEWLFDGDMYSLGQVVLTAQARPGLPAGSPRRLWFKCGDQDIKIDFHTWAVNSDEPRPEEFAAPPVPPGWRVVHYPSLDLEEFDP